MSLYRPPSKTTSSSPSIDDFIRPKLNLFRNVYGVNNIARTSLNFSQQMFEEECKRRTSHFAFSPVSILLFFSELACGGSQGGTKEQILQVFKLFPRFARNSETIQELLSSFHKILQTHDSSASSQSYVNLGRTEKKKKKKKEKGHVLQWNDFCFINQKSRMGLSPQFKKIRERYFPTLEFRYFRPRLNDIPPPKSEDAPGSARGSGEEEEVRKFEASIVQLNEFIKTLTYGKITNCLNPNTFKCREFFINEETLDPTSMGGRERGSSRGGSRSKLSVNRNLKKGDVLMIQTLFCALKWKSPFTKVIKRQRFFTLTDSSVRRTSTNPPKSPKSGRKKSTSGRKNEDSKDDNATSNNNESLPPPSGRVSESTNCFVDMMLRKNASCFYGNHSWKDNDIIFEFTSVILPFHSSSYTMMILLPENKGIKQMNLIQDILVNKIFKERDLFLKLKKEQKLIRLRKLLLPKFSISYSKSYKNLLEDMGLKLPFSNIEADFFNLTNNNMRIIDIVQNLEMRVEEDGLVTPKELKRRRKVQLQQSPSRRLSKKQGSKSGGLTANVGGPKGGGRSDGHSVLHGKLEDPETDFIVNRPFFGIVVCTRINFPLVYMKVSHPTYTPFVDEDEEEEEEEIEGEEEENQNSERE